MVRVSGRRQAESSGVLPGFNLTLGVTMLYLGGLVVLPLSLLFLKTSALSWRRIWTIMASPPVLAAFRLSFGAAFVASCGNILVGVLVAWVLVRYRFPARRLVDGLVDLPFALPTAVAGICLATIYSPNAWLGEILRTMGVRVNYTPLGIVMAMMFVGLPFMIRSVQPVLEDLDGSAEEAAATLGASSGQTFRMLLWPALSPAVLTGFTLTFARAIGEYGSVVFISGNIPMKTQVVSLLIMSRLDEFDYAGASTIAVVLLAASFLLLLAVNVFQSWSSK